MYFCPKFIFLYASFRANIKLNSLHYKQVLYWYKQIDKLYDDYRHKSHAGVPKITYNNLY